MMRLSWKIGVGLVAATLGAIGAARVGLSFVAGAEPSGGAPGTPTIQELAERMLAPAASGATAQLLPGQWPSSLPVDVPTPPSARLVGSVEHNADGKLQYVDGVLDATGAPADLLAFYQQELSGHGWTVPPAGPGRMGGFQPTPPGMGNSRTFCKSPSGPSLSVTAASRAGAATDLRLHLTLAQPGPCGAPPQPPSPAPLPNADVLPPLQAPAGVPLQVTGNGGAGSRWTSEATAETKRSPAELETHFAQQLQAAGWTRLAGGADGPLAWSTWKLPRQGDWQGLLLAFQAPGQDRRSLLVRAEEPVAPGPWSGGLSLSSSGGSVTSSARAVTVQSSQSVQRPTPPTPTPGQP